MGLGGACEALDVADVFALVEVLDEGALLSHNRIALLDGFKENPAKLLGIMLLKTLSRFPTETLSKVSCVYRSLP